MKTHLLSKIACLAVAGAALAWHENAQAQNTTNLFEFDATAQGFLFPSWAGEGTSSFWDSAQDSAGNPSSGAQYVYLDLSGTGGQLVGFQNFTFNPYYPLKYNNAAGSNTLYYIDLSAFTNLSMDIKWDTAFSTIGIDSYNTEAFAGGGGTHGLELDFMTGSGDTTVFLTNLQIPRAASNGWTHVNIPIPTGLPIDQTVGFWIKKYTGSGYTGIAAMWIDNIQAQAPGQAPPPPTLSPLVAATPGLNIYDNGNPYDRQSVGTIVTNQPTVSYTTNGDSSITTNYTATADSNYSWVGSPTPVSYSGTIAKFPTNTSVNYQFHIMVIPGRNIPYYETAPDYNEANVLMLFADRQSNGSILGQLRYKVNEPNGNGYIFNSDPMYGTNTLLAGYGGLLGQVTNTGSALGTWTVTVSQETNITVQSPDGHIGHMAFPQLSDAELFAGPVTVFWGTQPNGGGLQVDTVLSHVAISGGTNTLNVDLTQPFSNYTTQLGGYGSLPASIFSTPANSVYWMQWTLPDSGFKVQSAGSLLGPWTTYNPAVYSIGGKRATFITTSMEPAGNTGFFRLMK